MGSELYKRQIPEGECDLMRKVWSPTPWMVDAYTGSMSNDGRYREILEWCQDNFGGESIPLHKIKGNWRCGGATVMGHTWMGFKTKEMMDKFIAKWGDHENTKPENS